MAAMRGRMKDLKGVEFKEVGDTSIEFRGSMGESAQEESLKTIPERL